jgi:hypothetical protein
VKKPVWDVGATPFIKLAPTVMDCKWLVAPQPSILNTSNAQTKAAKRVFRFTAEYLQKEIFRIVAASVTRGKVTKVMALTRT